MFWNRIHRFNPPSFVFNFRRRVIRIPFLTILALRNPAPLPSKISINFVILNVFDRYYSEGTQTRHNIKQNSVDPTPCSTLSSLHFPVPNVTKRLVSALRTHKYDTLKGCSSSLQLSFHIHHLSCSLPFFLSNSETQRE